MPWRRLIVPLWAASFSLQVTQFGRPLVAGCVPAAQKLAIGQVVPVVRIQHTHGRPSSFQKHVLQETPASLAVRSEDKVVWRSSWPLWRLQRGGGCPRQNP